MSVLMRARVICFLPCLACFSGCQEATDPAPEYQPEKAGTVDHALCLLGYEAVPLREVSTGHHLVEVTINGMSGSFVLDTGANVTVVDQNHVGNFDLSDSGVLDGVAGGVTGGRRATQVSVDSFRIGSVDIRQQRIVTADLGGLLQALTQVSGDTIYGLIGQDVLTEHRAIVDVSGPMLYLMEEDRDPAPVPAEQCRGASQ